MRIHEQPAIDVHAHYGACKNEKSELLNRFMTGDIGVVLQRARLARTRLSIVSPVKGLLRQEGFDVLAANEETAQAVADTPGLLQWVVVSPLEPKSYEQARSMLRLPKCAGIKIHPELHGYPIAEHGREIFRFAAEHAALLTTHSGEKNCMPEDFLPFADEFPQVRLILAHLGFCADGDPSHQVCAARQSRHGNVFIDTSSQKSLMPGLIEWAVAELGPERLLYGTDSPLYFAPMQRARIDHAQMPSRAKRLILHDNAAGLLGCKALQ